MKHKYQKPTAQWLSFRVDTPITLSAGPGSELDDDDPDYGVTNASIFNDNGTIGR